MSIKSVRMESFSKISGFSSLVSVVPFLQDQLRQVNLYSGLPSKGKLDPGPREIGSWLTWALWSIDKSSWECKWAGLSEETFSPTGNSKKGSFSLINSEPEPELEPELGPLSNKNPLPSPPPSRKTCLQRLYRRLSFNRRFRSHWTQIFPRSITLLI